MKKMKAGLFAQASACAARVWKTSHLRAFAVMAGVAVRGRIPLRPDSAASFPKQKIYRFLSKNPVNLSNFIEIYGNSIFSNETARLRHHTRLRPGQRDGNCGQMRVVSNGMRRISSGRREGVMSAPLREKPKANGRPLQHIPSTRKPGDGNCGEMRPAHEG